jgi:hypothetical protein
MALSDRPSFAWLCPLNVGAGIFHIRFLVGRLVLESERSTVIGKFRKENRPSWTSSGSANLYLEERQ